MILLNELLFHPTKEVKQGLPKGQSDRDARDNNIGDSSGSKMIAVPLVPQGVVRMGTASSWNTHSNIHQFTGDVTGKRQNVVPHVNR
jgi:hypothetical protein